MEVVLAFGIVLLAAVLVSARAHRTVLSTTVLFLAAGFGLGAGGLDVLHVQVGDPIVRGFATVALYTVLFTDALRIGAKDLVKAWQLPGRALLVGMPITFGFLALLARALLGLPWVEACLVAAILSPTDPVFAAAIVGRDEIPGRLRHLLNVESGLNDGLALPVVVVLLETAGHEPLRFRHLGFELGLGVVIGIGIPILAILVDRIEWFAASSEYEPFSALGIALTVLAACSLTNANPFLGAFAAGVTVATMSPGMRDSFRRFGELLAEVIKLAAVLVFASVISADLLRHVTANGYVFVAAALLVARPAGILLALVRSRLDVKERLAAAWFGPKGFASVVYALLVLDSRIPRADGVFTIVAVAVAVSIAAHSSTDVLVARAFGPPNGPGVETGP